MKQELRDGLKPQQWSAVRDAWFWQRPRLKAAFRAMNRAEYGHLYSDYETDRRDLRSLREEALTATKPQPLPHSNSEK